MSTSKRKRGTRFKNVGMGYIFLIEHVLQVFMSEVKCKPVLNNEERILVHLLQYVSYEERMHVPAQVTQKGIADKTGIRVNHIPRTMRKLVERNEIEEYLAYVTELGERENPTP